MKDDEDAPSGAEEVRVTVNQRALTIAVSTTVAELFAAMCPEVAPDGAGYWILAREDGARYVENPQRNTSLVTELFEDGVPAPLYIDQPPHCRHGSPAVKNRGFLCGWC